MKTLLVVYSYHHNNTQKIAEVFAKVLDAKIITPQQTNPKELKYRFGGFRRRNRQRKTLQSTAGLRRPTTQRTGKKAFIFSTSGVSNPKYKAKIHTALREKLQTKGYTIVDEFNCHGFNTNSFLKVFGGMNKGRPDAEDLKHAEEFAQNLRQL